MSTAAVPALDAAELLRLRMRSLGLSASDAPAPAPGAGLGTGPGSEPESAPRSEDAANAADAGQDRVAAVARHLLAAQGQDWRSSRWALGRRAHGTTLADVHEAFDTGLIVRSWPMRGTIHVTAAEDIGWMQRLTGARVLAGAAKRRDFLGLDTPTLERMIDVAEQALSGGRSLDRDELGALWTEAGIDWKSNWRYHVIWWMCQNGIAVFGPVNRTPADAVPEGGAERAPDAEPRLVLASERIRNPRDLDGDDALVELVARYAAARGPVQVRDLAWWSGLTMRDVKRGVALAAEAGRLAPVLVDPDASGGSGAAAVSDADAAAVQGVRTGEYWCDPALLGDGIGARSGTAAGSRTEAGSGIPAESETAAPATAAPAAEHAEWLLLPSFDEHLLGYTDRAAQLRPDDFDRVVPGRNGMFLATVVRDGRTVATWKRGPRRKAPEILVSPLPGYEEDLADLSALAPEARAWAGFHGRPEPTLRLA